MKPDSFEFWFDFSCPYAYLASTQVQALAERSRVAVVPRPMLLGGVFRAVEQHQNLAATLSAPKASHMRDDLRRYAALWGASLRFPSNHPMRTVTALRALIACGEGDWDLIHAIYRAYWVEGRDISDRDVIGAILNEQGHDADAVLREVDSQKVKDRLRALTDEAIGHGIFGAPSFRVGDELLWGQDRMDALESSLTGQQRAVAAASPGSEVDFWFDYSSPFAAIGNAAVAGQLGGRVRYRPMLLGAVFKSVGMHNVPLFEMSKAKRDWVRKDMLRQAKLSGFDLQWPSSFPLRSVLPLRVTLLAGTDTDRGRALIRRLFSAYWTEGRDISKPEVVAAIASECGLDGEGLVAAANKTENKALLNHSTTQAVEAGVFGAPTFIVHHSDASRSLYWGVDRLHFAVAAAGGDERLR